MDRFAEMQAFVRVAETLSVTRAAAQLNIAPSAVSRRVRDLEARLGTQLLQRTTRRISLTDAGRSFYGRCLQVLADLDDAEGEAASDRTALSGTLRLAVPLSFTLSALSDAITEFMARHPRLIVHVDLDDRRVDLVAENIDLAIRLGQMRDSSLVARRISLIRNVVCASPAFLERYGRPETPEQLAALPALCYANVETPEVWEYTGPDGRPGRVRMTPRMYATNGDALRDAAVAGLGIMCEPSFIVYRQVEQGLLTPVMTDYRWPEAGVYAVYPPTRHLPARARALLDFFVERFGSEPPWERCLPEFLTPPGEKK